MRGIKMTGEITGRSTRGYNKSYITIGVILSLLFQPVFLHAGGAVFKDGTGREVVFSRIPLRIVSTAPAITDILKYIGMEKRIIACTTLCSLPASIDAVRIGDINIDYEKLISLSPDLIFTMKGLRTRELDMLASLNLPFFVLSGDSIEEVFESIDLAARILGASVNSGELRSRLETVSRQVAGDREPRSVYFEIWGEPPMSVGAGSLINDIIRRAGGKNVFEDNRLPAFNVSVEKVMEANPEVIILAYPTTREAFSRRPGWNSLAAVSNNEVYIVEPDIFVRPGPQVVEAVFRLNRILYPRGD